MGVRRDPNPESRPAAGKAGRTFGAASELSGAARDVTPSDVLPQILQHRWWIYVGIVNVFFILVTFYVGAGFPKEFFLRPLALSTEQGIATWWAGVLFIVFALMARSTALQLRPTALQISRGLTVLAVIGLLLFVDEVGSIHERVKRIVPLPGEAALVPLAIIGAVLLATSLFLLIQRRDIAGRAPWMIVTAFFLFGCVYVLEFAEHRLTLNSAIWQGSRFAIEEGLELTGTMLLIASVIHIRRAVDSGARSDLTALIPTPQALLWLCWIAAIGAIPLWLLRTAFTVDQLRLPLRGDFGLLIPIAVLVIAAFFALLHGWSEEKNRVAWWSLAALLLVASIDLEVHFHHYFFHGDDDLRWRSDLGLLWTTPMLLFGVLAVPALRTWTAVALIAASYVPVVASLVLDADALIMATPYPVAFVMVYLVSRHRVASGEAQLWRQDEPIPAA